MGKPRFRLRCKSAALPGLADRFGVRESDASLGQRLVSARRRGWMAKKDLRHLAKWKAVRSSGRMESNSTEFVEEVTRISFGTKSERVRIEALTLLDGVGWPSASVILHFAFPNRYPILDIRAFWTLSQEIPSKVTFPLWWDYVEYTRALAGRKGLSMRDLDKALWQYSLETQP